MSHSFYDYDKNPANKQAERLKHIGFCEQMKLFILYENPITFALGHIFNVKYCKRRHKTQNVKQKMKGLARRFDLKKILLKLDRFEDDIGRLLERQ